MEAHSPVEMTKGASLALEILDKTKNNWLKVKTAVLQQSSDGSLK